MLMEINDVKQIKDEGFRRWFADDYFDLIIWYDDDNSIEGFQLCYNIQESEHSLTWLQSGGFSHNKIDAGELTGHVKMSPILVSDGVFDKKTIAERFKAESMNLDSEISSFIYEKILTYPSDY